MRVFIRISREEYEKLNHVCDIWEKQVADLQAVSAQLDDNCMTEAGCKLDTAIDAMGAAVLATAKFVKKERP